MIARIAIGASLVLALFLGGLMYYLQVYAYYTDIPENDANVQLTLLVSGQAEPVLFENYKGIDGNSSPLRYRACYRLTNSLAMLTETYVIRDQAEPRNAPGWFDCFDAEQIGKDLEDGTAIAFLGQENIIYGIDRIVAVYSDGRAFAWHDINACGEVVFDGNPAPDTCPPPPESLN